MAIWVPGQAAISFGELLMMGAGAQKLFREEGVRAGDHVLVIDHLGPRLYAAVTGLLALGACVVLVEPWMPVAEIERVIQIAKPKAFLANTLGHIWGLRVPAVRAIPRWIHSRRISAASVGAGAKSGSLVVEDMDENTPGILTFTSGTTGRPKGVVRNQGYLVHQHRVLSTRLELEKHSGPDLCIFANFALANLASGRGSIVIPPSWKARHLRALDGLYGDMAPESMTCGPAFLLRLMEVARVPSLRSIHVGGALTDCWIFEKAFAHFPNAHFAHVYGSSEAEPVAVGDAHEAVRVSRAHGYHQVLCLGRPVPEIQSQLGDDGAWITGPHVCPRYLGNEEENRLNKRTDEQGRVWHFMGDRVREDAEGWWYAGRSAQNETHFALEQKLYGALGSSKAFIHVEEGAPVICVADARQRSAIIASFIQQEGLGGIRVYDVRIHRDRRHRARIDRAASWKTRRLIQER